VIRSGVRFRDESGQSLIVVGVALAVLCSMAGFAIDVGRAYVAYRHLQAAVDASALAAAQYPDPAGSYAAAKAAAIEYSACTTGDPKCPGKNTYSDLGDVAVPAPVTAQCRNQDGTVCAGTATAMHIEQTANVPMFFAKFLGLDEITVTAKATALFKGGVPHPLDAMVVMDTTGSMGQSCTSPVSGVPAGSVTALDCAKEGVRALLGALWPCNQGLPSCAGQEPVDRVGLMIFPPLINDSPANLATRRANELDCVSNVSSSDVSYTGPNSYSVVPFSNDYRVSASAPINGDSDLVKSVWWYQCPGHVYPSGSGASSIGGGPSSSSDRTGAANATIAAGPSSSSDRSGASNASTIGGGSSSSSNRTSASTSGGAIAFGSAASNANSSSGSSTLQLTKPSNVANNDVLIAGITVNGGSSRTITAPAGWNLIRRTDNGTSLSVATYYHVVTNASSEGGSYTWSLSSGTRASGGIIRYTGVDTSNPIDVTSGNIGGNTSTSVTASSVTPTAANEMVVGFFGINNSRTFTAPSGMTERYDVVNSNSSGPAIEGADYIQATAVATGDKTATLSSSTSQTWAAQLVALRVSTSPTSLTLGRPTNRADGDLLLVSVTARNLDGGTICAPADGTWTQVQQDIQGAAGSSVTHATFWSVRNGMFDEFYTFNFNSGSCGGSPVSATASAVAVRFTGVDTTSPVDVFAGGLGTDITPTAPAVITTFDDDRVVRLYGSRATSMTGVTFPSTSSGTSTGVEDAAQATAGSSGIATATTASAPWVAHTVALKPAVASSITINRPSNRADGDLLLVSVTARNLDAGNVCAPDGTWTLIRQDTQGAAGSSVTQATFWSFRAGTTAESYTFAFRSGSCPAGGSPVNAAASAVAVRYTGVDTTAPIDVSGVGQGTSATVIAPAVTTTFDNDRVVRLFGTRATAFSSGTTSFTPGSGTATGVSDSTQAAAGLTTTASAGSNASAPWVAHTVALKAAATSIKIDRPSNRASNDFLLVSVTARNLDAGLLCAPSGWTLVRQDTQGAAGSSVTHATFWSFRSGTSAESYTFTFRSGSCSSGTPLSAAASAVSVRYTGVDPAIPIDVSAVKQGSDTTPTAPAVTTNFAGDRVVRLFGSRATPISSSASPWFPQPGSGTSTGVTDSTQAAPGTTTQPTATTASAPWVAHTVALKFIGTCSPCYYGVEDGSNTYYRDAINAAQAELVANGRPNATHAIIFLGDGGVNTTVPGDALPCHSPITASQNAQNPTPPLVGTWVYSIAYNATGNCSDPIAGGLGNSSDRSGASIAGGSGSIGGGAPNSGSSSSDYIWNSNSSGDTSVSINRPSNRLAGDFLLATITARDMLATENICAPSGWTSVRRDESVSGTSRLVQQVFWKFSATTSSDTSNSFTFRTGSCPSGGSSIARRADAMMIRYTGVDTTTPIDIHNGTTTTTAGTSLTAPAVTTTADNDRVVNLYGVRGSTSGTNISGVTFDYENGSSSNNVAIAAEDFTQGTAGLTAAGAATSSNSGLWVGQTVALKPVSSATTAPLTIDRPTNRADGDFLLVSVTARDLDAGNICPPDGTWTLIRQDTQGPAGSSVTHATFWSFRTGTAAESYTFTFRNGACPSGGSTVGVAASGIAVRYTGVDPANPIDVSGAGQGTGGTLTAPAVTTNFGPDEVVRLYGTRSSSISSVDFPQPGSGTSTGVEDASQASAGSTGTATATTTASAPWVAHTVALKAAGGTISAVCLMHRIADPSSNCVDNSNSAANNAKRFFNQPASGDLTAIFTSIGNDLTTTRLIDEG